MNSLFMNSGFEHIAIQIISHLDVKSFLKIREVNKSILYLVDNELFLWRNALKKQLSDTGFVFEDIENKKRIGLLISMRRWQDSAEPFFHSLEASKSLVFYFLEVLQKHFKKNSVTKLSFYDMTITPFQQACQYASPALLEFMINHIAQTDDTTMEDRNVFEIGNVQLNFVF